MRMSSLHAVPADAQVVWGSASCQLTGSPFLTCELDMSDPRVSGTETIGTVAWRADRQWTVQPDVITNAEGTWRGIGQGSDDEDGAPLAEARFVGEGGYEDSGVPLLRRPYRRRLDFNPNTGHGVDLEINIAPTRCRTPQQLPRSIPSGPRLP